VGGVALIVLTDIWGDCGKLQIGLDISCAGSNVSGQFLASERWESVATINLVPGIVDAELGVFEGAQGRARYVLPAGRLTVRKGEVNEPGLFVGIGSRSTKIFRTPVGSFRPGSDARPAFELAEKCVHRETDRNG